jgi:hypothetical protein
MNILKNFSQFITEGKKDIIEFTVPDWAMSALINGDYSGLNKEDEEKVKKFIENTVKEYGHADFALTGDETITDEETGKETIVDNSDLGFRHSNDIDNLGTNCCKILLLV